MREPGVGARKKKVEELQTGHLYYVPLLTTKNPDYQLGCALLAECRLWQYGLWSFQMGGTKLERFLRKNQHT